MAKLRVAIIGTGKIGTDLLVKVLRSQHLTCTMFVGRRVESEGIAHARALGLDDLVRMNGITSLELHPKDVDLVFDATSAADARVHAPILKELGKIVIDLTPARVGPMVVPIVNGHIVGTPGTDNVNMVTCGGQASIPIAHKLGLAYGDRVQYIEVVSSIASKSAGPATRRNLDEYIHTTEKGLASFTSGAPRTKAILNLNPAEPCVNMQTTVLAKVTDRSAELLEIFRARFENVVAQQKCYVPGYEVLVPPTFEGDRLVTMIKVTGRGDYLPAYAGNLDIINCAAIETAESYARRQP